MTKTATTTEYICPYCQKKLQGPHPALAELNFKRHVLSTHPEENDEFLQAYEEIKKSQMEEQKEQQKQEQLAQAHPTIEIPFQEVMEPGEWIVSFLSTQAGIKEKFQQFQKNRVKLTGRLPDPVDLESDLKDMDSGVKNNKEAAYIKMFYEAALEEYLHTLDYDEGYGKRGIRVERERQQPANQQPLSRGIPVTRRAMDIDQYAYPQSPYVGGPSPYGRPPQSWMEQEFMRLQDDLRRRDDEDRRRRERENTELRQQLIQLQQGGGGLPSRIEAKMEQMEADRRRLEEQYAQLKENTLLQRIQQAENVARSGPSADEIRTWLRDTVNEYRSQIMVEKNLEEIIDKKLQNAGRLGPSPVEVEMEKARNELVLGTKKLEIEEKKAGQWGETLKNVAGVFGEGLGKGMASKSEHAEQQTSQTFCPHCNTHLTLPPNIKYGICPSCNGKIEVDANGMPQPFIEPPVYRPPPPAPIPTSIPEEQPEEPMENVSVKPRGRSGGKKE